MHDVTLAGSERCLDVSELRGDCCALWRSCYIFQKPGHRGNAKEKKRRHLYCGHTGSTLPPTALTQLRRFLKRDRRRPTTPPVPATARWSISPSSSPWHPPPRERCLPR